MLINQINSFSLDFDYIQIQHLNLFCKDSFYQKVLAEQIPKVGT